MERALNQLLDQDDRVGESPEKAPSVDAESEKSDVSGERHHNGRHKAHPSRTAKVIETRRDNETESAHAKNHRGDTAISR